ncbi:MULTISPECIES: hypothetical protein [Clostridium]|uniref:hypothetical protein n=1 Tax=Clostridium TaxID=1485 RepID=UPI000824EA60|nr:MULTISPECIES: hypothetical protein [Clostridium]
MTNEGYQIIAIAGVVFGVLVFLLAALPYARKKGVNVENTIGTGKTMVDDADKILNVASDVMPGNSAIKVLEIIEKWAKIAVGYAEQLSHAGDIGKDERAQAAENVVLNVLSEMNVTVDDNKKALIDATIKNAVNDLGHTPVNEAQKTAQIQEAQNKLSSALQDNVQLKQKLNTIQSVVK